MRIRKIIATLVAGGMTLATANLLAQDPSQTEPQVQPGQDYKQGAKPAPDQAPPPVPSLDTKHSERIDFSAVPSCQRASHIIGLEVRNDMGDRLGRIHDLIISLESDRAPFAIVSSGSAFGIGGTRVAVPLKELKLSDNNKMLTLNATKDQFSSASPTPTGAWASVADQEWAKNVDRFYGQPTTMGLSRFERQSMEANKEGHEFVRSPQDQKGASGLINQAPSAEQVAKDLATKPTDSDINTQVTKLIEQSLGATAALDIQASVENGVVTLKGKVPSAQLQRSLYDQIKALTGVNKVDDQLTVPDKDK